MKNKSLTEKSQFFSWYAACQYGSFLLKNINMKGEGYRPSNETKSAYIDSFLKTKMFFQWNYLEKIARKNTIFPKA
jgi:hypothetical protein